MQDNSRENNHGNGSSTNSGENNQGNASSGNSPAESIPNESSMVIYNNDPINSINNSSGVVSGYMSGLTGEDSNPPGLFNTVRFLARELERQLITLESHIPIPLIERFRIYVVNWVSPDVMEESGETVDSLVNLMYTTREIVYDELETVINSDQRDELLGPVVEHATANLNALIQHGGSATLQLEITRIVTIDTIRDFLEMVEVMFNTVS